METQNKQFGTQQKQIPPLAAVAVVVGFFLIGLALLNTFPDSKADAKSTQVVLLEEQVKAAQLAYESSSQEAVRSMQSYCSSWVNLATLKTTLATALKMPVDPSWNTASVECDKLTIPSSF